MMQLLQRPIRAAPSPPPPPPLAAHSQQTAAPQAAAWQTGQAALLRPQPRQQQRRPGRCRPPPATASVAAFKVERRAQYKIAKEPMAEFGFSKAFSDRYELGEKIGKGASCTVHAAVSPGGVLHPARVTVPAAARGPVSRWVHTHTHTHTSHTHHLQVERASGEAVAVKVMPKRFGPDGFLDKTFAARVRNEVDISSHLGRR